LIVPIRCFTCGALLGDKYEEFVERVRGGEDPGKVLDSLGIKRYCCRRMLLSHVDLIDEVIRLHEIYGKHKRVVRSGR